MRKILFFSFLFISLSLFSQKKLNTVRVSNSPEIDGNLDDVAWSNADIAKDFVMFRPGSGNLEPENQKTEVKVVYDKKQKCI